MKPLVFFHGFTGAPSSFDRVRAELQRPLATLAPALAGHWGGPPVDTFEGEVTRLARLIREGCESPPVLIGYSLGARLALAVAATQQVDVAALVLVSVNPGLMSEADRAARRAADERHADFLEQHGTRAFIDQVWAKQPLFASQARLPTGLLTAQATHRRRHEASGLASCLRALGLANMPSYWEALPALAQRVPLTLVTGALDEKFCELSRQVVDRCPQSSWLNIADVGHNPLLEAPAPVAEAIARHLRDD